VVSSGPTRRDVTVGARGTQSPRGCRASEPTSCDLPRHPVAAGLARRELETAVGDLADDLLQVAQVLTSELVTNAVNHGRPPITLRVLRDDQSLTVQVVDHGSEAPVIREHDLTSLSGRGMQLVEALATAWGTYPVEAGPGKTVWFELRL
jgi:anti-sigma regulatory factor (Ser/Thr protein kinase)